ncbi:MAG: hypothetical protein GY820_18500 [Gammaproteobacteria bacterium]|nr:hypothetical protein [Gammaproteobacteria bacterium]
MPILNGRIKLGKSPLTTTGVFTTRAHHDNRDYTPAVKHIGLNHIRPLRATIDSIAPALRRKSKSVINTRVFNFGTFVLWKHISASS